MDFRGFFKQFGVQGNQMFSIPQDMLNELEDSLHDMQRIATEQLQEIPMFDGLMDQNKPYQIRTGIIQDPSYNKLMNRVDKKTGERIKGKYSVYDDEEQPYPYNGKNAVDPYGMRVSVVWLDGHDAGMFHDATKESNIKKPVQKIWLTFPNVWADMDRNCGEMNLPLPGTIVKIGMSRGDVGVYLGTVPLDKAKLPIIRLGDYLKKHYNQNTQYMTDQSTLEAYLSVLKNDVYKEKHVLEPRPDSIDKRKPVEDDEEKLSNLHKWDAHRHVMASDGVSTSVKVACGKHDNICGKRVWDYKTNLSFSEALNTLRVTSQPLSGKIISPDGLFEWSCKDDSMNPPTLRDASIKVHASKQDMLDVYATINNHFVFDEILDVTISAKDMVVSMTETSVRVQSEKDLSYILEKLKEIKDYSVFQIECSDGIFNIDSDEMEKASFNITTNNLTLEELADILDEHFELDETRGIIALTNDATVAWTRRRGTVDSSITEAEELRDAIFKIMGRPGKYYTVTGSDRVLSGSCPLPEPSDHEDTCSRPND